MQPPLQIEIHKRLKRSPLLDKLLPHLSKLHEDGGECAFKRERASSVLWREELREREYRLFIENVQSTSFR